VGRFRRCRFILLLSAAIALVFTLGGVTVEAGAMEAGRTLTGVGKRLVHPAPNSVRCVIDYKQVEDVETPEMLKHQEELFSQHIFDQEKCQKGV
jgi:hypothetical protein